MTPSNRYAELVESLTTRLALVERDNPFDHIICLPREQVKQAAQALSELVEENARLRGPGVTYERGYGPGDGDSHVEGGDA